MLRARISDELAGSDALPEVMALVDALDEVAATYRDGVTASLEAYVAQSRQASGTVDDLIAVLAPLELDRRAALVRIVDIRESMRAALSDDEWDRLFN